LPRLQPSKGAAPAFAGQGGGSGSGSLAKLTAIRRASADQSLDDGAPGSAKPLINASPRWSQLAAVSAIKILLVEFTAPMIATPFLPLNHNRRLHAISRDRKMPRHDTGACDAH